ncbi:MAG: hypothetical protein K2J80_06785 [Oscillospiraceae bacterium]|nr:hypothetical protein [Oscillospiraceae bacterium]
MKITINNEVFTNVTELHVDRELRKSEIRYNTQGDMLIDLITRKYALSVSFGLMTENDLKKLRRLSQEIFVSVTFHAPEGDVTADFHISNEPAAEVKSVNGVKLYGGVKLEMKQR